MTVPISQKTIAQMTGEVRANNIEKGWRTAEGGPGDNTLGDYLALLHSEVAEALEAYRDYRLNDGTKTIDPLVVDGTDLVAGRPPKPEGVGSELADVLIRLLDTGDVFGIPVFDPDFELADVVPLDSPTRANTFGDDMAWLHQLIAAVPAQRDLIVPGAPFPALPQILRGLVAVAERYDIDLMAEYERKLAYNRTRTFQHGGRTLAATNSRPELTEATGLERDLEELEAADLQVRVAADRVAAVSDEIFARARRNVVHGITDGSAATSCCGKTPFELPAATHRLTQDAEQITCPGRTTTAPNPVAVDRG